ncbi:MAG: acyl carrier protein [Planctomycetota bacterium]
MPDLQSEIRQFIVESFLFGQDDPGLGNADSLLENGVIDSTGVLELVGFLEERFRIQVADRELVPENLDSVERISTYVRGKLDGAGA